VSVTANELLQDLDPLGPQRLLATFARFAVILTNSTQSNKMHNM